MKKDYYCFGIQCERVKILLFFVCLKKNSQYSNFEEMTHSFQETLRHDDFVIMSDPCANLTWIEAFLTTSDHLDLYMHR